MLDQSQIMADKQKRKLSFLLKSFQQFHDLSLNGYVQSAGGFIADHQPGIYSQRPGYGCPLAFSSAYFMRISFSKAPVQFHLFQKPVHSFPGLVFFHSPVPHTFHDPVSQGASGIKGILWGLKDHLELCVYSLFLFSFQSQDFFTF